MSKQIIIDAGDLETRVAVLEDKRLAEISIEGKDVLILEDIVDTGLTLSFLVNLFRERNPRSVKVCALLDKRQRREVPFEADYVGFTIEDGFVVGYGIDFNEKFRYLPEIYIIEE